MKTSRFRLAIATKIVSGFMAVLVLLAVVSWISIVQVDKVDSSYSNLLKRREIVVENVKQLKTETIAQENAIKGLLLTNDGKFRKEYSDSLEIYNESFEQFEVTAPNEAAKKQINDLNAAYATYHALIEKIIELHELNSDEDVELLMSAEFQEAEASFNEKIDGVLNTATTVMAKDQAEAAQKTNFIHNMLIWATVIAVVLGIAISLFISRFISKPVMKVSAVMGRLANGDFSIERVKIKNRDEIGDMVDSMNRMVQELGGMLSNVSESSEYLAASAEQLSASSDQSRTTAGRVVHISQQSAAGAERQLESFKETSGNVEEIVSEVERISQSSEAMLEATVHSTESTNKAVSLINNVVVQMNEINLTTESTAQVIRLLEERSHNISAVVSLITTISQQTNLLALNAAIEAARAGEQGKGFAVVADQIRKLAEETRRSAEEVIELITLIQQGIAEAAEYMEKEGQLVTDGLTSTHEAKDAFADIAASILNVTRQVREVTASVDEIKDFSKQITVKIEHVNAISEEGLQLSLESSAASEEQLLAMQEMMDSVQNLSRLAEDMQRQAARFKF
ncbi:methyl-accepting chemotaxis protein [Paenibacillus xylaniclasticus]|uniref:methyl-accepting chemotaxis protein n=1 Tax=Paenibacillus xylaniclasticus TaxID=588083 RepID=UPI0013DF433D|nr:MULTISPECIES: methyl-accepting chemotaxis protein [Paenibacillus]